MSPRVIAVPVFALLLILPPAAAQSDPEFGLAMTRLELDLDLDYEEGSLAGHATYEIANRAERPVSTVPFNLGRLMTVDGAMAMPAGVPLDVVQDVVVFTDSPRRQVNHVVVSLPQPLAPGASVTLRVAYRGYLVGYTETGSLYIQDKVDPEFSILRTDAFAWPVPGTLNQRTNRTAPRPDFPFRIRITVPAPYVVASSGRLVEQVGDEERRTYVYESHAPTPFLNIPIARYTLIESHGVRVYHLPGDGEGARRVLQLATEGLALLEAWFGPLGTDPDLTVMEIPEMWGSQASLAGGIIQTADVFREAGQMTPLYHELTHLWNAPDVDQPSARWNEGLAMFLAYRMAGTLDGWQGLDAAVERTADWLRGAAASTPELATVPFFRYGEAGVTDLSYRVGFLMFYALHRALGDDRFDAAVGGYYQEHRDAGGTFEELLGSIRAQAPGRLDTFFQTWVHSTGWYDQLRAGTAPSDIGIAARR